MVYVNSKKFACESCIKGHRSSSCHHTDRPLFEIKKKGRPVSQCDKCRELRKSKRVHSKCTCNPHDKIATNPLPTPSGSKSRRFIPIIPTLPNGLKDALNQSHSDTSLPDSRQRVDTLLNPCNCGSVWKCNCKVSMAPVSSTVPLEAQDPSMDLATLAQVASMRCCEPSLAPSERASSSSSRGSQARTGKHRSSTPESPNNPSYKRLRTSTNLASNTVASKHNLVYSLGPELPPIYLSGPPSSSLYPYSPSVPDFEVMPPMSTITSLAGTGCTCGVLCACPGCVEHRIPEQPSFSNQGDALKNCADGCSQCIDPTLRVLPGSEPNYVSPIDMFLATVSSIPPPPTLRGSSGMPMVTLPKLECCGGQCGCPNGHCACRKNCGGCCSESGDDHGPSHVSLAPSSLRSSVISEASPPAPVKRSCCAGKAALRRL